MSTIKGTGMVQLPSNFLDSLEFEQACSSAPQKREQQKKKSKEYHYVHAQDDILPVQLSEIFSYSELDHQQTNSYLSDSFVWVKENYFDKNNQVSLSSFDLDAELQEEIVSVILELVESSNVTTRARGLLSLLFLLKGEFNTPPENSIAMISSATLFASLTINNFELFVQLLQLSFSNPTNIFDSIMKIENNHQKKSPNFLEIAVIVDILLLLIILKPECKEQVISSKLAQISFNLIRENIKNNSQHATHFLPIKKVLLLFRRSFELSFGSIFELKQLKSSFYAGKKAQIKSYQHNITKYQQMKTEFKLDVPFAISEGLELVQNNLIRPTLTDFSDDQLSLFHTIEFEEFMITVSPVLKEFFSILLTLMLSTSSKPLISLTTELSYFLQQSGTSKKQLMRNCSDEARQKDIIFKTVSAIVLLFVKHTKFRNVEYVNRIKQILDEENYTAVLLTIINNLNIEKFLYRSEYSSAMEYYCSSLGDEIENVPAAEQPCTWRNMFSLICQLQTLYNYSKNERARLRQLLRLKANLICLKLLQIENPLVKLFTLKLFKVMMPYLNSRWKQKNFKIISLIYLHVPLYLMDDWLDSDSQSKSDYH